MKFTIIIIQKFLLTVTLAGIFIARSDATSVYSVERYFPGSAGAEDPIETCTGRIKNTVGEVKYTQNASFYTGEDISWLTSALLRRCQNGEAQIYLEQGLEKRDNMARCLELDGAQTSQHLECSFKNLEPKLNPCHFDEITSCQELYGAGSTHRVCQHQLKPGTYEQVVSCTITPGPCPEAPSETGGSTGFSPKNYVSATVHSTAEFRESCEATDEY